MFEVEVKAMLKDSAHRTSVESKLKELGAQKHADESHCDAIYGQAGNFPPKNGGVIARIRNKNGKIIVGIKEIDRENGGIELENQVQETKPYHHLLQKIGFQYFFTIEKSRKKYTLIEDKKTFTIDIDQVKELGTFIEVELLVNTEAEKDRAKAACLKILKDVAPNATITKKKLGDFMAEK